MSETNPPVVVIFRKWKEDGEILALFPTEIAHDHYCTVYAHVGQHSAGDYHACIALSTPATPAEYASLKRELESEPYNYNLTVRKRYTRSK
jgi:hypothetical protein